MPTLKSPCNRTQHIAVSMRRNFVIGPTYANPAIEINTIPARVIQMAAAQKEPGGIWMDMGQEVLEVAHYDGKGAVQLGDIMPGPAATPETLIRYAESLMAAIQSANSVARPTPILGAASFYRPDPACRGPIVPLEVQDNRMVAMQVGSQLILNYDTAEHMPTADLVEETLSLLESKPEHWEARVAERIKALGMALRFYEGSASNESAISSDCGSGTPAAA